MGLDVGAFQDYRARAERIEELYPPGPGSPLVYYPWQPSLTIEEMWRHIQIAIIKISAKRLRLDRRWSYYRGLHSEVFLTDRLSQVFRTSANAIETMFTNYCSLVVDAPLHRLKVTGFRGDPDQVQNAEDLWLQNDLDLEAEEVHRQAICAGESYVTVWPRTDPVTGMIEHDTDGDIIYDLAYQESRNMHVEYGSRRRRDRSWACKVWLDEAPMAPNDTTVWRAVLYYPEEIVRFVATYGSVGGMAPRESSNFKIDPDDPGGPNPFGKVPVIRFARFFDAHSRLDDCIPIQDRINKLTADKVVAAEYAAYPQRWALTNDQPPTDMMRGGPGTVWVIPPTSTTEGGNDQATSVGQFPSAELANFDRTIQQEVNSLFAVAELPRHLLINPGVAPSGQAILADEGPMVASVAGYRDIYTAAWAEVLELVGVQATLVWQDIEVHNELTSAQTFREMVTGGLPVHMAAELALDLPQEDLDQLRLIPTPPQPGAGIPGQAAELVPAGLAPGGAPLPSEGAAGWGPVSPIPPGGNPAVGTQTTTGPVVPPNPPPGYGRS